MTRVKWNGAKLIISYVTTIKSFATKEETTSILRLENV